MAQALDGAGRWGIRAGLGLKLRRTPGWMPLGQLHERRFLSGRQPIGGALGTGVVIHQCPLKGRKRSAAPFIEDATAHPETGRHAGDGLASEQREDGLEAVFPGGSGRRWGGPPA